MAQGADLRYYEDFIRKCALERGWTFWYYEASVITPQGEHLCDLVNTIDIGRDFVNAFSDTMVLEVQMTKKFYIEQLYPVRDNFKIRLKRTQVPEQEQGMRLLRKEVETFLYKGVLVDPVDMTNNSTESTSPASNIDPNADNTMVNIKIQLIRETVEQLMKMTFGGCWDGNPGDILKGMLTEVKDHIISGKEEPALTGVDMIEPDNPKSYHGIVIPHGTKLTDIPRLLQSKWYGIYNYDIGSYIHEKCWYLYPLFNYQRFPKARSKLTLAVIPKIHMHGLRRTYRVHLREAMVIVSGGVKQVDKTNETTLNQGDGVTFYDANKIKNETIVKNDQGVYIKPQAAQKQVQQHAREDQKAYLPYAEDKLSTSAPMMQSMVSRRDASIQTFTWEYAHPMLLEPGMACQVTYFVGDKKYHAYGTLLAVHGLIQLEGRQANRRHSTTCTLTVALDRTMLKDVEKSQFNSKGTGSGLMNQFKKWF